MMTHRMRYSTIPTPLPNARSTNSSLMIVASIFKYWLKPPHTPPIIWSVRLRYNRLLITVSYCMVQLRFSSARMTRKPPPRISATGQM